MLRFAYDSLSAQARYAAGAGAHAYTAGDTTKGSKEAERFK